VLNRSIFRKPLFLFRGAFAILGVEGEDQRAAGIIRTNSASRLSGIVCARENSSFARLSTCFGHAQLMKQEPLHQ
jgi:hypothetical protein